MCLVDEERRYKGEEWLWCLACLKGGTKEHDESPRLEKQSRCYRDRFARAALQKQPCLADVSCRRGIPQSFPLTFNGSIVSHTLVADGSTLVPMLVYFF